jgi:hypothetical protein
MMRLVIEDVQQNVGERLLLRLARCRLVCMRSGEIIFPVAIDHSDEPVIFSGPGARQVDAIFVQDFIQPFRLLAFARQSRQPESIGQQQMIESAVQAVKEDARITAIKNIGQRQCGLVQPCVGPSVVAASSPNTSRKVIGFSSTLFLAG